MFLTRLFLQSLSNGRWRLDRTLRYRTGAGDVIEVPAGYITDLFSVPRLLWWLFPRDRRGREAAVVHDYLYTHLTTTYTRAQADAIFREALAANAVNPVSRWLMWAGVRIGGRGNWPPHRSPLMRLLNRSTVMLFCLLVVPALLFLTQGCSTLAKPQTAQQQLAYLDTQFAALVYTAADLRADGLIPPDKVPAIDSAIRKGDTALSAAWAALSHGTPDSAADYISAASRVITELTQALQEVQRDPQPIADPAEHTGDPGGPLSARRTASLRDHHRRPATGPGPHPRGSRSDQVHAHPGHASLGYG